MTPPRTRTRTLAVTAAGAVVLLLAGCTGGSGSGSASPSSAASSASSSPTAPTSAPAPPAAPLAKACYRLSSQQLTRPTNGSHPVPCSGRHTAKTIFVGKLDTVVDGHSVAVDSSAVQRQLSTTCPRKLAAYVGGTPDTRDLARLNVVWYSPSLAQSDRGADWFRCDVIAFSRGDRLYGLPRGPGLKGTLARPGGLDTYGLCGTAAPGAPGFVRVICALPHSWRAVDTIGLPGPKAYPGASTVRAAGDGRCKALARSRSADALSFRYGWEWPTGEQWTGGQHYGFCWVPV